MTSIRKALLAPVAAIGLTATLLLSGCFANPVEDMVKNAAKDAESEAGQKMAEDLIEDATGGKADVNIGKVPTDFPKDVPRPDLKAVSGVSYKDEDSGGKVWAIQFETADLEADATKARKALLGAGFEESSWGNIGGMLTGAFTRADYLVNLGGFPGDGGEPGMLSYSVVVTKE